jgi:hypothetical protein
MPTLLKLVHEKEREGTLLNSYYEASIKFIPKAEENTSKNENYRTTSLMNIDAKIHSKIMANRPKENANQNHIKISPHPC